MKYAKEHNVLPDKIIKIIQEYIDRQYLYIPRKNYNPKSW